MMGHLSVGDSSAQRLEDDPECPDGDLPGSTFTSSADKSEVGTSV